MRLSAILLTTLSIVNSGYAQSLSGQGDATFRAEGPGVCGIVNTDADLVVAIDHLNFDAFPGATSDPEMNPLCGRMMLVVGPDGKEVVVTITDSCETCSLGGIDLSPAAFVQLAPFSVGRIHGVRWTLT